MGRSHSAPKKKRRASKTASKIVPRLYLTDLATARDVIRQANLGITHVISVIEEAPTFPSTSPLRKLHVPLSDCGDEDILTHLSTTTSFIRDALAENRRNRVLVCYGPRSYRSTAPDNLQTTKQVHCFMGINRSATVVIAYLIATGEMTPDEALATVRAKRPLVQPNGGFMSQLREYYSKVSDSPHANLVDESPPDQPPRRSQRNLKARLL
jgi:atypical dual specificity phosphatase